MGQCQQHPPLLPKPRQTQPQQGAGDLRPASHTQKSSVSDSLSKDTSIDSKHTFYFSPLGDKRKHTQTLPRHLQRRVLPLAAQPGRPRALPGAGTGTSTCKSSVTPLSTG